MTDKEKLKDVYIMKNNILKSVLAFAAVLLAVTSCSEPQPEVKVEPVFPTTVIKKTVAAGESVEIKINPNLAWEVSLSGEGSGNEFWIDDAGMKRAKVSGKEGGSVVITVVFADDEKFDVNRVCSVNLKMDGQSKEIAVLTLPSIQRSFEVYEGVAGELGFTENFGTEKKSAVSLKTFTGETIYKIPIRVVSNFEWKIAAPDWLDVSTSASGSTVGTTDLLLTAKLSGSVMTGAEGSLRFIDENNNDASFELKVSLPAFQDRVEYTLQTTFTFNAVGDVLSTGGTYLENLAAFFELLAVEATTVKVVEWNDENKYYATSFADWATVTETLYDTYSATDVLAKYTVEVAVTENKTSSERFADVFVIPASKASVKFEDWFDPNTGNLKPEFAGYIVGRISQVGIDKDYITLSENPDEVYKAEFAKYTEQQWWAKDHNVTAAFELVYTDKLSDAVLVFDKPFASYKIFDCDNREVASADLENFWLGFNPFASNSKGRVVMDPAKFTRTDLEFPESFIVFYNAAGTAVAGLSCRHTTKGSSVVTEEIYSLASGVGEIVRMSSEDALYQSINGNFSVTEIYKITTNDKHVLIKGQSQYEIWNAFGVDPVTFGELNGPISLEPASPNFDVYTGKGTERAEALFILQSKAADESLVNFAAIYVIYDPAADIEIPSPFNFVNPGAVAGLASLAPYTGSMAEQIMGEQYGITADKIYELKYMDASASSVATITIPSNPVDNAAWNNYPYSASYWLSCEVNGSQMTVYMAKAGLTDYFLFKDPNGLPAYVLVCTLAQ